MKLLYFGWLALFATLACQSGEIERPGNYRPEDTVPYAQTPVGRHGQLHVDGLLIKGEAGETVQLKGISSQWLNWEGTGYARNFAALMWVRDHWGVQVIRAAMGVGDSTGKAVAGGYLDNRAAMESQIDEIVENARELGVYVIIDWHDHYAYFHQEEAQEFFREVAAKYKDYDHVLYETFNEPMTLEQPNRSLREYTWSKDIKPYHEAVIKTIRQQDKDALIILGTPRWSQEVDKAAADPIAGKNLLYTLHFYACTHQGWLRDLGDIALNAGLPLFVSEWGATDASGGTSDHTVCSDEADQWHAWMDAHSIGWAAWKFDDCSETSCLLKSSAPVDGPFDMWLQGHGPYVVNKLLNGSTLKPDAGTPDASTPDASTPDASTPDASTPDASTPDASVLDASVLDASVLDAG